MRNRVAGNLSRTVFNVILVCAGLALLTVGCSDSNSGGSDGGDLGGTDKAMCAVANDGCTLADDTVTTLTPRQLAQIWNEATADMAGARTAGGATSCESAVAIALMECGKIGSLTPATYSGIDTPICSIPNSAASGVWQVTSQDSADLSGSGCSAQKSQCDLGDPCCNARLAYSHAKLKCTATVYDAGTCTMGTPAAPITVTTIPDCSSALSKNMPCYDGPFCLNTELDSANAPYAPPTAAIDACFPGIQTCMRPALDWGGWGAVYDYYHNSFCCLDGQCGASSPSNNNWNCWEHGQTDEAYACEATNPQNKEGSSGVTGQSTATTGELATEACAAVTS